MFFNYNIYFSSFTRLKLLKDRIERSGIPETLFFVVISASPSVKNHDDDLESAAWEGVAPEEIIELTTAKQREPLDQIISPDIFVIQDNDELGIWKDLKGSRDQILVIDRCGKLAYQVIVPWSILHFPYVKAAILSTHKDDPCGHCDSYATVLEFDEVPQPSENLKLSEEMTIMPDEDLEINSTDKTTFSDIDMTTEVASVSVNDSFENEKTTETQQTTASTQNDEENYTELPGLRIIMHAPHYHVNSDSTRRHEYLVIQSDKPDYHGHLDIPGDDENKPRARTNPTGTIIDSIVFDKDESPGLYGEVADFWRDISVEDDSQEPDERIDDGIASTNGKTISGGEGDLSTPAGLQDEPVTNVGEFTVEEEESRSKLIAHYSRLLPWIYYVLSK